MRKQTVIFLLLLVASAFAARPWTQEEFDAFSRTYKPQWVPRPQDLVQGPRRYNYLQRVHLTCNFIRTYQVADSGSADFGGIIEAEHMPTTIETDNTQEAVWVWSRWFQLTGDSTYRNNIRRAWTYVRSHAAYHEHGGQPANLWYAIWNCGLGFMAETEYRHTFGDTTFRPYGDTCRDFYIANRLPEVTSLDWFVTAQSAGMAYNYALDRGDAVLAETALARGTRVKAWIEQAPSTRLATQNWAMCGGTAFWGVMNSVGRADTLVGRACPASTRPGRGTARTTSGSATLTAPQPSAPARRNGG